MNQEFRPPHWSQFLGINFRKLGIGLIVITGLIVVGLLAISEWRLRLERKLIEQATTALQKGDVESSILCLRQVLQRKPDHLQATAMMAELAEAMRSPACVLWYERLSEVDSRNPKLKFKWASVALKFGEDEVAERALSGIKQQYERTPQFQDLSGMLAIAQQRYKDAEVNFQLAAELEPHSMSHQLKLAVVQVQTTSGAALAAVREKLVALSTNQVFAVDALRALVAEAYRRKDFAEAIVRGNSLMDTGKALMRDRIYLLEAMSALQVSELSATIQQAETAATATPDSIGELTGWMCQNGRAEDCLTWLEGLGNSVPILRPKAYCLVQLKKWTRLRQDLKNQKWNDLEFLRLAYLSRAERELGQENAYLSHWRSAEQGCRSTDAGRFMLARQVLNWGWAPEAESVYWSIVSDGRARVQALGALHKLYVQQRDESQLLRVSGMLFEVNKQDLLAKNNLAQLQMLAHVDMEKAYRMAAENHQRFPSNTIFLSTYAFALYQQEKPEKALQAFEQIPKRSLSHAGLAGYYGLLLEANHRGADARPYLDKALASDTLLPSERRLLMSARSRLP